MVEAVVEYDYIAHEADELTIRKGDVIRDIVKKPGGWWEGTLREKRGMFPDNFVSVIQKESKLRPKPNRLRQCRAIFSYHPAHDDELSLSFGDIIDVVCEVEEGWWKGKLGSVEGVFPSNFVVEIDPTKPQSAASSKEDLSSLSGETDLSSPNLPPKPSKILCQVKYPYEACNDDELTLKEGDLITLISKDGQDRGWWRGELKGRIGVFPDNFVTVVPSPVDQNGPQHHKSDKKPAIKSSQSSNDDSAPTSTSHAPKLNIASQRRSIDLKSEDNKAPPLPGKKPNVPKKSPSSAGNYGPGKKVDRVDGANSSRILDTNSRAQNLDQDDLCDFDQVERSAMLQDMRAHRVKAPGRRPPSVVYRETDSNLLNGNAEHFHSLSETSNDEDETERRPKFREWEKHKAPWVEELKLNQAKRAPVPDPGRPKPSAGERLNSPPEVESEGKMRAGPERDHATVEGSKLTPGASRAKTVTEGPVDGSKRAKPGFIVSPEAETDSKIRGPERESSPVDGPKLAPGAVRTKTAAEGPDGSRSISAGSRAKSGVTLSPEVETEAKGRPEKECSPVLAPGPVRGKTVAEGPVDGSWLTPTSTRAKMGPESPSDGSKSGSGGMRAKTGAEGLEKSPTGAQMRPKTPNQPVTPLRPQSITGANLSTSGSHNPSAAANLVPGISNPTSASTSPAAISTAKPPVAEKVNLATVSPRSSIDRKMELVSMRQYLELQERISQMEMKMQQQFLEMQTTIEELKGRLQVETDMRRLLQAELEKVAQCVTQV